MSRKDGVQFDWDAVRARLERSRRAVEGIDERDPQALLAARARALAALAPKQAAPDEDMLEVLVFRCGGERYAFETAHIAHVCPKLPITRIHGTPNYVVGVVAQEGEVISVIDLRSLLALPVASLVDQEAIVVLRNEAMEFGVLADEILGVERHRASSLEQELPALPGAAQACLVGITSDRTAILDARVLLADPALVVDAP